MKKFVAIVLVVFGLCSGSTAMAASRCPANDMGCTNDNMGQKVTDRIEQGKKDVSNASGVVDKATEVGKTIRDCTDCGMKVMTDAVEGAATEK